jgi:hypothetical protein
MKANEDGRYPGEDAGTHRIQQSGCSQRPFSRVREYHNKLAMGERKHEITKLRAPNKRRYSEISRQKVTRLHEHGTKQHYKNSNTQKNYNFTYSVVWL